MSSRINGVFHNSPTYPKQQQYDSGIREWSPGQGKPTIPPPVKFKPPVQRSALEWKILKIESALVNWFLHENPPADHAVVVRDSIQEVDPKQNLWKAKVMTTIAMPITGLKQHISVLRFRLNSMPDPRGNAMKDHYSIHHNQLMFPS